MPLRVRFDPVDSTRISRDVLSDSLSQYLTSLRVRRPNSGFEEVHSGLQNVKSLRIVRKSPYYMAVIDIGKNRRTTRSTKVPWRARTTEERRQNASKAYIVAAGMQRISDKKKADELTPETIDRIVQSISTLVTEPEVNAAAVVETFFVEWLATTKGRTLECYQHVTNLFFDSIGDRKKLQMRQIRVADIRAFLKLRKNEGVADTTLRQNLKILNTVFLRARKLQVIQTSPVEPVLATAGLSDEQMDRFVFTCEEVARLIEVADADWEFMVQTGFYVGTRIGDAAIIQAKSYDFEKNTIYYLDRKKNKFLKKPMHRAYASFIRTRLKELNPDDFMSPELCNLKTGGSGGLSRRFMRLMNKAGIDSKTAAGKGKRKFSELSYHSLRHTMNSNLANAGVPQEMRMALVGHDDNTVNDTYTHLDINALSKALDSLPALPTSSRRST